MQNLITDHLDIWTAAHKTRSTAGRGSNNKLNLHGIKKLRELILELAVRGKLVPQDASDEPASKLLEMITAEKTKLIKEGKLKKDKTIPDEIETEKPFAIPSSWQWSKLSNISIVNPRNSAEDELETSFVPMTLIDSRFDGGHEQELRLWREIKQGFTHFAEGDIGVAKITPCFENSKACVFKNLANKIGAGTTELHIVRPINNTLNPRYVLACLKSPSFLLVGETKMTGTAGQKRLPKEFLESYPFALPPLPEQHRIVAKVDELMAFCDQLEQTQSDSIAAHAQLVEALLATLTDSRDHNELQNNWQRIAAHFDTLFITEHSIDQLKQTILQLAVMGKLVPQNPNDEPASVLLKKIAAEKAQLIKDGKIKKEKPLPEITEEEKPFELPRGWEWAHLIDCGVCSTGGTPRTSDTDAFGGTVPFIGPGQITPAGVLLEADKFLTPVGCLSSTVCESGDILMVCIGGSIGKSLISNTTLAFNQQINCIKPIYIQSKYLNSMMNTYSFQSELLSKSTGSATPIINRSKWEELLVAIPPQAEQHCIVAKVDELMTFCDALKTNLQNAQTTQLALADALVEQAVN